MSVEQAKSLASTHYENFPVAPFFLAKKYRSSIALIYAFARMADDIADEGNASKEQRFKQLQWMHDNLLDKLSKPSVDPFFRQLNEMIDTQQLPCQLFHDLLDAFIQDLTISTYENFGQVLEYCQRSANPIGRLLLHLCHETSDKNLQESDDICSALQLINFIQDWYDDLITRDRLYFPLEDLSFHQLSVAQLKANPPINQLEALLETQWHRAHDLLNRGAPLGHRLNGRFGFKIRLTIMGGFTILKKCRSREDAKARPTLNQWDWIQMVGYSLLKKTL